MFSRIADGRTDLIVDWLAEGHAADATDKHGTRLIQWCAYHGDVTGIRVLLERGESLDSLGANYDLNGAAFQGHWQLCQFLVEVGADVNFRLPDTGETPLHAALCKANRPIYDHVIEVLVAAGADPNIPTLPNADTGGFMRDCRTKGETPLHRAAALRPAGSKSHSRPRSPEGGPGKPISLQRPAFARRGRFAPAEPPDGTTQFRKFDLCLFKDSEPF